MSFKGTAAKSSTGASMSKYDVEVEARLKKLEAAVAALQSGSGSGGNVSASGLKEATKKLGPEAKIDAIIDALS